jgi:hypothetical protein
MVPSDAEDNFEDNAYNSTDVMAMDSKSLAVGSPLGLFKMFSRKDLGREKVFFLVTDL